MPGRTLGDFDLGSRPFWQVLARASTIAPKQDFVKVTGVGAIDNITRPNSRYIGPLRIRSDEATPPTWTATGNIAVAGTFTRYKVFEFLWDPVSGKWHPNAVA